MKELRNQLVRVALSWESAFGNAPQVTTVLSEYDAASLVGCSVDSYAAAMSSASAVQKGHDFVFGGIRYQVKANRPSGKRGSKVTLVPKARNYAWDRLIWILYNRLYEIEEAWQWEAPAYREAFDSVARLSPHHMRLGKQLA
jgi:hypothetical protein